MTGGLQPMPTLSVDVLLRLLDEAYDTKAWHGPNLRGVVRLVTPAQAAWRPAPGRHTIYELVQHAAYWKYTVRNRILGGKRGSFALKGSNWFAAPDEVSAHVFGSSDGLRWQELLRFPRLSADAYARSDVTWQLASREVAVDLENVELFAPDGRGYLLFELPAPTAD